MRWIPLFFLLGCMGIEPNQSTDPIIAKPTPTPIPTATPTPEPTGPHSIFVTNVFCVAADTPFDPIHIQQWNDKGDVTHYPVWVYPDEKSKVEGFELGQPVKTQSPVTLIPSTQEEYDDQTTVRFEVGDLQEEKTLTFTQPAAIISTTPQVTSNPTGQMTIDYVSLHACWEPYTTVDVQWDRRDECLDTTGTVYWWSTPLEPYEYMDEFTGRITIQANPEKTHRFSLVQRHQVLEPFDTKKFYFEPSRCQ